jgi:ribulose-phosphate 3-epimerase
MSIIVPAILPTSLQDLEKKLAALDGVADSVQIDVVDGRYVSPASWPYTPSGRADLAELATRGESLLHGGRFELEIDLMVSEPEKAIGTWIAAGASRLVIHAESTPLLTKIFHELEHTYGHDKSFSSGILSVGLAVRAATDLALIEPYLEQTDFVQFMGIDKVGSQGQPFNPAIVQKIRTFRRKHPQMPVQVDGGVSKATAPTLLAAGVHRLIVGSALWKAGDLAKANEELTELAQEYGIYE